MIALSSYLSVIIVSLISLVGAISLPLSEKKLQSFLIYFVSFSAGAMLGDVFIHLLPEVTKEAGFTLEISTYVLIGIMTTFIIEKFIHWKHHADPAHNHAHPVTALTLIGDSVHNFIDGLVIGASYLVSFPVGLATTLAVILHEIPQEIGNFGILIHGGYTRTRALWFNFLTALTAVLGTTIALFIGNQMSKSVVLLSAFAAGNFIYIAASDLIPEMHKEVSVKKSSIQFLTMLLGIGVMLSLLLLDK